MTGTASSNGRPAKASKLSVKDFWNSAPCGLRYGEQQDSLRYQLEPEIDSLAEFSSVSGLRLLEIGLGMGSDFIRFVRGGAVGTGVDLTERAIEITRAKLDAEHLKATTTVADAEELPFEDGAFDVVYSWGVLHHTPDPAKAIAEAVRVLAPGGSLRMMLYHRHSWVAAAAWVRFCLLRGRPFAGLREAVSYMESPGTQAFLPDEVRAMLGEASEVSITPWLTVWDRKLLPGIASLFGNRLGWFLLVRASKSPVQALPAETTPQMQGVEPV
jgi:ubiquinone/menaquinone biosynthesis C-methylase UbiE